MNIPEYVYCVDWNVECRYNMEVGACHCVGMRGGPSSPGVFQVGLLIFGCQGCDHFDIIAWTWSLA